MKDVLITPNPFSPIPDGVIPANLVKLITNLQEEIKKLDETEGNYAVARQYARSFGTALTRFPKEPFNTVRAQALYTMCNLDGKVAKKARALCRQIVKATAGKW